MGTGHKRMEDYPGQAYFHANNPNIKRAEDNWLKTSDCWEWKGSHSSKGYGHVWRDGKLVSTHRLAAHVWLGMDLGDERHVLHRCDNPACVNPGHLFIGTNSDNQRDLVAKGMHWNTRKTYCKNGHPYTLENTYVYIRKDTHRTERSCKICLAASADRLSAKKRGEPSSELAPNLQKH